MRILTATPVGWQMPLFGTFKEEAACTMEAQQCHLLQNTQGRRYHRLGNIQEVVARWALSYQDQQRSTVGAFSSIS